MTFLGGVLCKLLDLQDLVSEQIPKYWGKNETVWKKDSKKSGLPILVTDGPTPFSVNVMIALPISRFGSLIIL